MNEKLAKAFIGALQSVERDGDLERMVSLFAEDAELWRSPREQTYRGKEGARAFWKEYVHMFDDVETEFRAVTVARGRAVLEWTSRGRLRSGSPFSYSGASVIEGDAAISSFRTYYDAMPLLGPNAVASRSPGAA